MFAIRDREEHGLYKERLSYHLHVADTAREEGAITVSRQSPHDALRPASRLSIFLMRRLMCLLVVVVVKRTGKAEMRRR